MDPWMDGWMDGCICNIWYSPLKYHLKGFKVAIESWHEWDVRCPNRLSYQAMSSTHTQSQLYRATPV